MEGRKIAYSKFSSLIGTNTFNVFLNLWIINVFGDTKSLAYVLSTAGLSSFLFSFIGGTLSTSSNLIRIVKIADLCSFFFCIIAILFQSLFESSNVVLLLLVFLLNVNVSLTSPSIKRLIGLSVERSVMVNFNNSVNLTCEIIKVLMPIITSFLYGEGLLTIQGALAVNGFSFFISFLFLSKLNISVPTLENKKKINYITALKEVRKNSLLLYLLGAGFLSNVLLAGYNLLMPTVAVKLYHSDSFYGLLMSIESLAAIIGLGATKWFKLDPKLSNERKGLFAAAAIILISSIYPNKYIFCISSFVLAFFYARYNVGLQSYIQMEVKNEFIGHIFSLLFISANIALPLGNVLFSFIIDTHMFLSICLVALGLMIINSMWFITLKVRNI